MSPNRFSLLANRAQPFREIAPVAPTLGNALIGQLRLGETGQGRWLSESQLRPG
jgi:hypothetical protein